jgi:hypothetical protein
MWANTVWGLAGFSFTCLLGLLGVSDPFWRAWLIKGAISFAAASFLVLIWPVLRSLYRRRRPTNQSPLSPDMKVSDAIDYIVNDSVAVLRKPQSQKGTLGIYPPGTRIIVKGIEHQDARERLGTKLNTGELKSWGRRQINTHIPNQFETSLREIPKDYWVDMALDFQSCLYYKDQLPQTMKIAGRPETYHWVGIMLSRAQIEQYRPQKSALRRFYARAMRKPRIKHAYGVTVAK